MFYILSRARLSGAQLEPDTDPDSDDVASSAACACIHVIVIIFGTRRKRSYKQHRMPKFHKLLRNFGAHKYNPHKINKHAAFGIHVAVTGSGGQRWCFV